ncbi:MAG: hypothetical protein FJ004_03030 [Chloroflexi bacterium]|nr:hypothetical protein [Chloroflexota bacterium]
MSKTSIIGFLILAALFVFGACTPAPTPAITPTATPITTPTLSPTALSEFERTWKSHFGFMPAGIDLTSARQAGGAWDRPVFQLFKWGNIETNPGNFDFYLTDMCVRLDQAQGFHIVANLQPFAYWDQEKCHQDLPLPPGQGPHDTKGKPCDMGIYENFIMKLVERYDGDGIDDMPGLIIPIKHWEVMNEPELNDGVIVYFQGTPAEYLETLQVTYEAVKSADPEALVVQGGMAGMTNVDVAFWQDVFELGGADYFDIANMHCIGQGEHLNIPVFKAFLAQNGIEDKPIWVTEAQYQQSQQTQNYTNEDFARILARSYIFALANGVDKLLYVNIKMPPPLAGQVMPFDERSALISDNGEKSALFYAHLTIANMLGELSSTDEVEVIKETVGGWSIIEGQYRFTIGGKVIYALWGSGTLPSEIKGQVRVTDISGAQREIEAASLELNDSPVFVEIIP